VVVIHLQARTCLPAGGVRLDPSLAYLWYISQSQAWRRIRLRARDLRWDCGSSRLPRPTSYQPRRRWQTHKVCY